MNLTKAIKQHAVSQVLIDQFKDERDALQKEIYELIDDAVAPHVENYRKARKAADSSGAINVEIKHQIYACVDVEIKVTSEHGLRLQTQREVAPYLRTDKKYDQWSNYSEIVTLDRKHPLRTKVNDYAKRANELHGQLEMVINSVRTVKKLRELTNVFDPFLPTTPAGMAMVTVPAEALCAINELKSPKHA